MSSATSTDRSTFRPWQFFVLAGLAAATAAMFVTRETSPAGMILTSLAIGAAAIAGIALHRTLAPFTQAETDGPEMIGDRTRAALEREKMLALRAIKELEFDRAMGKIAARDFEEMTGRLRTRALTLIRQLDAGNAGYSELIERELQGRLASLGIKPAAGRGAAGAVRLDPRGRLDGPDLRGVRDGERSRRAVLQALRTPVRAGSLMGSTRLPLAAALAVLAVLPGAAQIPMPDAREMSGIPRPVTDLPDGVVSVRLIRGELSNNLAGHAVELHGAGGRVWSATTDETGRAQFSGIAAGTMVHAAATVTGERLESQEFPIPRQGGIRLMLVATPDGGGAAGAAPGPVVAPPAGTVALGGDSRIVIELGEDDLQVFYLFDITNPAQAPVDPLSPIVFELPPDARRVTVLQGSTARAQVSGRTVTVRGPFEPGRTSLELAYGLPYAAGAVTIAQTVPADLTQLAVIAQKGSPETRVTSAQLSGQREMSTGGRTYVIATGPGLPAGGSFALEIAGLPSHSTAPRTIALSLALLVLGAGAWVAATPGRGRAVPRRGKLQARRDLLFGHLVTLEQQRHAGAIDPGRYAARRRELMAQLERVYGELDEGVAA
jgi:hypothetical protein